MGVRFPRKQKQDTYNKNYSAHIQLHDIGSSCEWNHKKKRRKLHNWKIIFLSALLSAFTIEWSSTWGRKFPSFFSALSSFSSSVVLVDYSVVIVAFVVVLASFAVAVVVHPSTQCRVLKLSTALSSSFWIASHAVLGSKFYFRSLFAATRVKQPEQHSTPTMVCEVYKPEACKRHSHSQLGYNSMLIRFLLCAPCTAFLAAPLYYFCMALEANRVDGTRMVMFLFWRRQKL